MISEQEVRKMIDRIKPNGILQVQLVECLYALLNLITQPKSNPIDEMINKIKEKK